jgi:magnesium transporter
MSINYPCFVKAGIRSGWSSVPYSMRCRNSVGLSKSITTRLFSGIALRRSAPPFFTFDRTLVAPKFGNKLFIHSASVSHSPNFANEFASTASDILEQSTEATNFQSSDDISCTIFDVNGKVEAVSRSFTKKDFIVSNGLHPRDLRHIETSKADIIPSILVRKDSILVCLLEIRAVIKCDRVVLIDSFEGMETKRFGVFVYNLASSLRTNTPSVGNIPSGLPYEMKALESILMYVVASLETELKANLQTLNTILQRLEDHVEHSELRELLVRDKALSKFHQKSKLVCSTISKLLDSDEDLVDMFLTERQRGVQRDMLDHSESELLLESYYKQVDEIVQQAEQVHNNIKNTEEIINIMLDANRNSLLLFELRITIATLGFTVGVFFTALYGMNLKNFLEESPFGFIGVTAVLSTIALIITAFNFKTLFLTQKVTLLSNRFHGKSKSQKKALLKALKSRKYDERQRSIMRKWLIDKT